MKKSFGPERERQSEDNEGAADGRVSDSFGAGHGLWLEDSSRERNSFETENGGTEDVTFRGRTSRNRVSHHSADLV